MYPDRLWQKEERFYYMAYHTVIFLDYYTTYPVKEFEPYLSFTIVPESELPPDAIDDVLPQTHYSQAEVISYIDIIRNKCEALIGSRASQNLMVKWIEKGEVELHGLCPSVVENYTLLEILFYNFRHVQHHVAQLNYILRRNANIAAEWRSQAE